MRLIPAGAARERRLERLLVVAVFAVYGSFFHGAAGNQVSRYATIFACVEPGPAQGGLAIDAFTREDGEPLYTADWACNPEQGPARYSNKAPGPALVGIPLYALYRSAGSLLLGGKPPGRPMWALHLLLTVLPVALSAPWFLRLLRGLGCGLGCALFWTLVLYFGSLAFPYSTQLWGHTTALAAVVALLYWTLPGRQADDPEVQHRPHTRAELLSAGAFAGLAVLSDYSCVLLAGSLTVWLGLRNGRRVGYYLLGALPLAVVYGIVHQLCFGNPILPAMFYTNAAFSGPTGQAEMLQLDRLYHLTLGPYRGLFFSMPLLLLTPWALMRTRLTRGWRLLCAANLVALLLLNTGFFGWHGGGSVGARYQIVVLPLYVLLLAGLPWRGGLRWLYGLLAAVGSLHMLVIACISPMLVTSEGTSPLFACYLLLYHWLRAPGSHPAQLRLYTHDCLGAQLGLSGVWALLPSVVLFGVFVGVLLRRVASRRARAAQ